MAESVEQEARDLLERMGIEDAQSFTAGDVVELANLINDVAWIAKQVEDGKIGVNENYPGLSNPEISSLEYELKKRVGLCVWDR